MSSTPLRDLFAGASRRDVLRLGGLAALGAGLAACSEVKAEPRKIKWGRDTCEFCHMVFADRRFAAEVWEPENNRARIYDDFGCAVLAASENGLADRDEVPFWVTDDADPARWLDARTAHYRDDATTPMGYSHSAGLSPAHRLDFHAAVKAIRDKATCEHRT